MPLRVVTLACVLGFAAMSVAQAAELIGEWTRDDNHDSVRFAPCGDAICGAISAKVDPNAQGKIGQRVFCDMKPNGENAWRGAALDPDDGREYAGKMSIEADKLTTAGCVFGGLICKSLTWSRAR